MNLGHELEVIWAERTCDPKFRIRPMASFLSFRIDGNPIRMGLINLIPCCVWVCAGDYHHSHFATSPDEIAERVGIRKPRTPMVHGDLCGVVRDHTASAQTGSVGVDTFEVVQPEIGVEATGIVFH